MTNKPLKVLPKVDSSENTDPRRRCLLVLGMHRSGTSAMTRILSLAGAVLPKKLMGASDASNPTGHWEPDTLVQYHDKILSELGSTWDDWRPLDWSQLPVKRREEIRQEIADIIRSDYGEEELFVLKDPRICRFANIFLEILRHMDVVPLPVLIIRNPLEVMESLKKRDGMSSANAALLWLRHVLEAERATRGMRRVFVTYAGMLTDWRNEFQRVADTFSRADLHEAEEISVMVEEFISPNRRHSVRSTEEVRLDPLLSGWVAETWEANCLLVNGKESSKTHARLDRILAEFNGAIPILHHMEQEKRRLKAEASDLLQEKAVLEQDIANLEEKISHLAKEKNRLNQEKTQLELLLSQAHRHAQDIEDMFRKSTSWKITAPIRALAGPLKRLKKSIIPIV